MPIFSQCAADYFKNSLYKLAKAMCKWGIVTGAVTFCLQHLGYVHTVPDSETERHRKCSGWASVHTRNAAFEAVSAPEQYCSAPLLRVEPSVLDTHRFLKRSESSLNSFIGTEIATEPRFVK